MRNLMALFRYARRHQSLRRVVKFDPSTVEMVKDLAKQSSNSALKNSALSVGFTSVVSVATTLCTTFFTNRKAEILQVEVESVMKPNLDKLEKELEAVKAQVVQLKSDVASTSASPGVFSRLYRYFFS